jgi:LPXTG-motif cell wall-anchored protein
MYLVCAVLGLVLAASNLIGGPLDGIAVLLGAAGLLIAGVGFVLWRKRRQEARLAE